MARRGQQRGAGIDQIRSVGTDVDALFKTKRAQYEGEQATGAALRSEDYQEATKKVADLAAANHKLADAIKRRTDLTRRQAAAASGEYAAELKGIREYQRELANVERLERRVALQSQYGSRLGGAVSAAERLGASRGARVAGGLAVAAAGTAIGMARSGFSGTVEQNRLDTELKLISRELAGSLKPAIDATTDGLQKFRKFLERLSPNQQNLLAAGVVGAAGVAGASAFSNRVLGMGLAEAGAAGASRLGGMGVRGAARGGAALAVGATLAASQFEEGGQNIYRGYKGTDQQLAELGQRKLAESSRVGRVAASLAEDTFGKLGDVFGAWGKDRVSLKSPADQAAEELMRRQKVNEHRNVTLAGGGFEEAGSAASRLASTFASREGIDGPMGERPEVTFLKQIAENTRPAAPPPAPPR